MPPYIGQLTKLQTLTDFLVGGQSENIKERLDDIVLHSFMGRQSESFKEMLNDFLVDFSEGRPIETSIKELGKLQHLRGKLHIRNLQNVVDARDAAEANLKGKRHLDKLRFTWGGDTQHVTSTLEKLEPNREVKDLEIDGYGGSTFPEWVGKSTFSKIVSLKLSRCENCTSLPPLGQLASLEELFIEGFDKVGNVGSEFYGNCTATEKPFKSLERLFFKRMPEWREWISDKSREAFPLLESLSIEKCPNLKKALPGHDLPRLTSLKIEGCEQLATPLPRFPRLLSLSVSGCHHSLESLPEQIEQTGFSPSDLGAIGIHNCARLKCVALDLVPNLNSLSISHCPDLESLCAHERPLNDLTSLQFLRILWCPKLVSFPKGGLRASVLTELELSNCINLKQLPESMPSLLPSLNRLEITCCSEVELCPEGGFPSKLQSLEIWNCNKLIAGRMQWGLQTLTSLSHIEIGIDENVESFPEEMLLPSSVTYLNICSLKHVKSLDYKGLQHLTSLRELKIRNCPLIESMPEEGLPSSLSSLKIDRCPMLKSLPRLQHLTSLRELDISDCPLIESMREEGLPSSLSTLVIDSYSMLKSLPRLQHLTSLRELDISDCPLIESMPEEGLPSSLSSLAIHNCPLLGESCEREKGKDWPKISHIPHIHIY